MRAWQFIFNALGLPDNVDERSLMESNQLGHWAGFIHDLKSEMQRLPKVKYNVESFPPIGL